MAAPVIFISTYAIKDGKLQDFRQFLQELFQVLEQNQPRALAINAYVNGDGTEVAIVQVPDGQDQGHCRGTDDSRVLHRAAGHLTDPHAITKTL